jgi:hypothetical protein
MSSLSGYAVFARRSTPRQSDTGKGSLPWLAPLDAVLGHVYVNIQSDGSAIQMYHTLHVVVVVCRWLKFRNMEVRATIDNRTLVHIILPHVSLIPMPTGYATRVRSLHAM